MHLTDTKLAALCGMTPNNLRTTYKKNKDPIKQRVYQFLRTGAEKWLEEQNKKNKNKELIEFLQNMEPIEIEEVTRRGRQIETLD